MVFPSLIIKNIRALMASECEKISKFSSEIFSLQVLQSNKQKARGEANKTPVLVILKRDRACKNKLTFKIKVANFSFF
jgi:hypothetical protein